MSEPFTYDSIPYPSFTFPKTSPERLATQAAVNGMKAADPRECTYLELGCGDGTNLLSHAYMYPESKFLGIDLSQTHIDQANAAVAELGINNAMFRQLDVMDLDEDELGEFDYITAHGLFSWVPEPVRIRLLDIYAKHLAPAGVGYISYNALPGCHIRAMMNEMMQYHTRNMAEPMEKVNSGASLLKFIGDVTDADSTYQLTVREELENLVDRSKENIFHDDLSETNRPFYLYEFAGMLGANHLQYLCEADEALMNTGSLSPDTVRVIDAMSANLIECEQYLDFIRCRRFRSTLFCREGVELDRNYLRDHIDEFYLAGRLRCEAPATTVGTEEPETFFGPKSEKITSNHPLTKAAIRCLSDRWTRGIPFDELIDKSVEVFALPDKFRTESDISRTRDFMIELFRVGMFRLRCLPDGCVAEAGPKPRASRFARWQVERGMPNVVTLTGLSLEPDGDATRYILMLADGTRDHDDLVGWMLENLEAKDGDQTKETAQEVLKITLEALARNGLLEA